ncbi:MAG TPA: hypothetical protein VN611_01900 [Patescibacteria group bacterium]|nr:hypothetical protein [Patescibacteria group bacterium]
MGINIQNKSFTEEYLREYLWLAAKNLGSIVQRLRVADLEHLSRYILGELPELITRFDER